MKKIIYSMMALAMTATVFTSCENVPAPYSVNFEENNNNTNTPTTPASGTCFDDVRLFFDCYFYFIYGC